MNMVVGQVGVCPNREQTRSSDYRKPSGFNYPFVGLFLRISTSATSPFFSAMRKAVSPSFVFALMSAPFLMRISATSVCDSETAM